MMLREPSRIHDGRRLQRDTARTGTSAVTHMTYCCTIGALLASLFAMGFDGAAGMLLLSAKPAGFVIHGLEIGSPPYVIPAVAAP